MLGLYASGRGEWLWANLSADHDLCWIQNCYTLKTTCSLEALDFQIMWLHVFPNSARNTVTNGEHQLKNSTHQSWVFPAGHGSKMPTSHPPSSPQCDHSPAFHRPCDHDFRPSSLLHRHDVVCQTKDRQRMFITKRIKNAQKFICEKNLHGWCRSVCSHKYYISILSGMAGRCFFSLYPNMLYIISTTIEYVPVRVGFVSLRVGCQILSSAATNLTLQSKFCTNLSLQ